MKRDRIGLMHGFDGTFFEPPMRHPFNMFVDIPEQIRQKSFKKNGQSVPECCNVLKCLDLLRRVGCLDSRCSVSLVQNHET